MEVRRERCRAGGGDIAQPEPLGKEEAAEVARAPEAWGRPARLRPAFALKEGPPGSSLAFAPRHSLRFVPQTPVSKP